MEAMPRLIAAHLEAHAQVRRGVVMGYFSAPRVSQPDDIFVKAIDLWWNDHFSEFVQPGPPLYVPRRLHRKPLVAQGAVPGGGLFR